MVVSTNWGPFIYPDTIIVILETCHKGLILFGKSPGSRHADDRLTASQFLRWDSDAGGL